MQESTAVETMAKIAREIESDEEHFAPTIDMSMSSVNHEISAQLARSAVRSTINLPIKYVVIDTQTGRMGRYLAAFRGNRIVVAVCYTQHAQRILALSYGISCILRAHDDHKKYHFVVDALRHINTIQSVEDSDLVTIVGGNFGAERGGSYVEIARVADVVGEFENN